jgi:hypothetical protein
MSLSEPQPRSFSKTPNLNRRRGVSFSPAPTVETPFRRATGISSLRAASPSCAESRFGQTTECWFDRPMKIKGAVNARA